MGSVWAESVGRSLGDGLELLDAAVRECPNHSWRVPMWRVEPSDIVGEIRAADGRLVTDPAEREALVQRWSAPWSVAWHALEVLDYDLSGELEPWCPPPPFAGNPHWQTFASRPEPWSRAEISGYIDHCRERVRQTFAALADERSATLLPPAHRYHGRPYASVVTSLIGHTVAHATQIRQFLERGAHARS